MSIVENTRLTGVSTVGKTRHMNTTNCHCEGSDGHDAECPRPRCPQCSEVYALDTAEKIMGVVYCSDCAWTIQRTPHVCWWCKLTFPALEMVNDGMWKCWPCYRAERGLEARDCAMINGPEAWPGEGFNYGRGR